MDELHIVFTEFVSMMTQNAGRRAGCCRSASTRRRRRRGTKGEILPLFDFEPSAEDVLDALLPRYVESRIYNALLQVGRFQARRHAAAR